MVLRTIGLLATVIIAVMAVTVTVRPADAEGVCRLDKVGTFAESQAGPQRIEVGGGGGQHVDYYPQAGVKAVSYIVGPGQRSIWWGYGSIWEGSTPECQTFDYVADATQYARVRLGSGHSGLVIDMRSGTPQIVANVADSPQDQVNNLLVAHHQGQLGQVAVAPTAPSVLYPSYPSVAPQVVVYWDSTFFYPPHWVAKITWADGRVRFIDLGL